jgi:hypothetical protein
MRLKLLGVAAAGALALALSGCALGGADATQVFHEKPDVVYDAFVTAWSSTNNDSIGEVPVEVETEKTPNQKLDVKVLINHEMATEVHFAFTPQKDGAETLVKANVSVDQAVMRKAFAGTESGARFANVPDFAYRMAMQRMLEKWASRVDSGMPMTDGYATAFAKPSEVDPDYAVQESRYEQRRKQEKASEPMVDPDANARRYLNGSSSY